MFKLKLINKPKMIKLKCGFSFPNIVLANLQEKEIIPTKNIQNIVADFPFDGLSKVTVNPIPDEYIIPSGEIEINANGNYNVTDKASARVIVPEKTLTTKTITANGTYNATDDNADGYSQVTVETSGVDINDYFNSTKKNTGSFMSYVKRVPTTIDFSGYTSFWSVFASCSGLEEIPLIDTSNAKDMGKMFNDCSSLKTIPLIDTSKVTSMRYMFSGCSSLKTIPLINTSKVTDMNSMFSGCSSLETIPLIDTSNATSMSSTFRECSNLKEIPLLNTSNVTVASNMFNSCANLITIPQLDTSNIKNMWQMFAQCTSLTTVPLLNCSSVTNVADIFLSCQMLENLGGLYNLGNNYPTSAYENEYEKKLNLFESRDLTHDSLMNVINGLYDIATKGVKTQQLVLGSSNLAKLTAEEIQIATDKGFSVS